MTTDDEKYCPHCIQESPQKKQEWLDDVSRRLPINSRVHVVDSDVEEYKGRAGTVVGYDVGYKGEWPLVEVKLDWAQDSLGDGLYDASVEDGFYDDELELLVLGRKTRDLNLSED